MRAAGGLELEDWQRQGPRCALARWRLVFGARRKTNEGWDLVDKRVREEAACSPVVVVGGPRPSLSVLPRLLWDISAEPSGTLRNRSSYPLDEPLRPGQTCVDFPMSGGCGTRVNVPTPIGPPPIKLKPVLTLYGCRRWMY
ncbi:hypothetical protein NDU88_000443 [Pleurodeles waltl]|uniref:Uncharacterized protein n=1 Tax=Pleurodeles waltl TaxID=8319 RepID=A0AAV7NH95_PLEWA|nr:hypothetical protein NDU88_000443 [Pleurodeles waltl]